MHDVGDMMVRAGFADPVMDMEYLTLTYPDVRALMRELKAIGAHNVAAGRNHALTGKRAMEDIERRYESFRQDVAPACDLRSGLRSCVEAVAAPGPGRAAGDRRQVALREPH